MSVSPIGAASSPASVLALASSKATASDGDSPAVEAAETPATKLAEKNNGGFAPKATAPVSSAIAAESQSSSASTGINLLA